MVSSTWPGSLAVGSAGAINPSDRRAPRARIASISCERNGLPSTAISASGSRSSASSENATRKDARSRKNGRSRGGTLSSAWSGPSAGHPGELPQLPVSRVTARRLERRRDASDRLDRLEGLEQLRHVHAEPAALRLPAGGLHHAARAQPEPQAAGDRQRLEPAVEAHGVVIRGDERVELFLLLSHRTALLHVGADPLHPARAVRLALRGQPLFR